MGNPQQDSGASEEGLQPTVTGEAQRIAAQLEEPLLWLVQNVINVLGQTRADDLLQQTLEIEAAGGLLTAKGDRQRVNSSPAWQSARETRIESCFSPKVGSECFRCN